MLMIIAIISVEVCISTAFFYTATLIKRFNNTLSSDNNFILMAI